MLFNSTAFIVFFIIFMSAWPLLRRRDNTRWIYITVMSFFFYGWWNWRYMFLLAGTGLIDFFAGLLMERYPGKKGRILFFSLFGNLGPLIFYKYVPFFASNINSIVRVFGYELDLPVVHFVLPVGISFYTFLSMSYAIDIYRGELKPTHNVFHYFALLSLFPHLVAGPIVRAADVLPQLMHVTRTTEQMRWDGMSLIALGYFKKVVIADNLAPTVNAAFSSAVPLDSAAYWWAIMAMFAFQIYCDFSGYSDIARGLAKWIGIDFMVNFDHPYISTSFREFWSRWHISLSTWFRDYVYIPIGGSRNGTFASHKNMWITMLTSGFWHGASWTFVMWGGLHAFFLSLERITKWPQRLGAMPLGRYMCMAVMFILVLISWVFFRAQTIGQALAILGAMFNFANLRVDLAGSTIAGATLSVLVLIILRQIYFGTGLNQYVPGRLGNMLKPVTAGLLLAGCIFLKGPGSAFIYFQF